MVGPTEALRDRASEPAGSTPPGPAARAAHLPERESGWQLAQRAWRDSGVDWQTAPGRPPVPGPRQADSYAPGSYAASAYRTDPYAAPRSGGAHAAGPDAPGVFEPDPYVLDPYAAEPTAADEFAPDGYPEASDAAAGYGRAGYAAAPVMADTAAGLGPWPVQPYADDPQADDWTTDDRTADAWTTEDWATDDRTTNPAAAASAAPGDESPARATLRYARQPPLPRRAPAARPGQPAALSEPDELFRAWQGSVREAAGAGSGQFGRRPAGRGGRRRRALQLAGIGVPAVVIVTVGAGALLMLTGRANDMLAARSATGAAHAGQTTSAAKPVLGGYPGARGGANVTAMWSAAGSVIAVGAANGHPAIWRHAASGGWPLVSAGVLGTIPGHLTAVAKGPAGWIAVGSVSSDGRVQPVVFASADGVTWRIVPTLTAEVSGDAQFLGVAAGPGGYLVVGREGSGRHKFAQLWWSADLVSWTAAGSSGYHNSLAIAAAADGGGFVAAGSQADCHTIWTSPDGRHWTTHDITRPAGARTATLRYAAAGGDGRVVTGGFAANETGRIPIVVTTDSRGARITQVVLPTGGVPGVVTGVTSTGSGFEAAGLIGPPGAQRTVTWTSADGLTWSAAIPLGTPGGAPITALTVADGTVTGTIERGLAPSLQTLPAP